jgi:catechol 2,3-dioxygenase
MIPGAVRLNVADVERVRRFYEEAIGLRDAEGDGDLHRLGTDVGPLLELVDAPGAPARPPGTTGLFHLAILVPSRADLAGALHRLARAGGSLTGASDHLVSEALYLNDPEGNGIEVYRDRPRAEWSYRDGQVQMSTLPLDLDDLARELHGSDPGSHAAPATRIGHVHLNVSDLDAAEAFYHGLLGLDVTVRAYPGALFLSSGGYHHHVGVNTWAGEGAPAPPPGALGLSRFELVVDGPDDLERFQRRLSEAGTEASRDGGGIQTRDPSGNGLLLRTR